MSNPLGRFAGDEHAELHDEMHDELVDVVLLAAPLVIWQRTSEHHDELMRELALLCLAPTNQELPTRLLELVDVLGRQYGAAGGRPDEERDAALRRGLDRLDLSFRVPASTAASAQRMRDLLDEAEQYCRTDLLTLEQPQVQANFARWYIDQFVTQCAGGPPQAWPGPWS